MKEDWNSEYIKLLRKHNKADSESRLADKRKRTNAIKRLQKYKALIDKHKESQPEAKATYLWGRGRNPT